jgi:peptidoglycan hydrolase-like protein with peptidoglycan-binding domain
MIVRAFTEQLHPRGTGAVGGQFVAAGAAKKSAPAQAKPRATKSPKGGSSLSFDGKRGAGYGVKGGDKRVKTLQTALNRLGLTDSTGKKLAVDGKLGPRTTAAIKKAQRKLGLKPDGVVTPALLRQLAATKHGRDLKKAPAKPVKKAVPAKKAAPAYVKPAKPKPMATVHRSTGYSGGMDLTRHLPGKHNQQSHANRLGKPGNIAGKTGLGKATAALADKPELGPTLPPSARKLDTYAARRDAVREHSKMTRSEFDALPEDRQRVILDELRQAEAASDTHTGRDGMGIQMRGKSAHVTEAKHQIWKFTVKRDAPPDNSVQGRATRLLTATNEHEARRALYGATKKDMDAIAEANGWLGGTSSSWKADKWMAYLIRRTLETGGK